MHRSYSTLCVDAHFEILLGMTKRLKTEALPPVLTEKQLRSVKLKKRRDRKRRILEADGGRCDGDMRMPNPELVQAGKRKVSNLRVVSQ